MTRLDSSQFRAIEPAAHIVAESPERINPSKGGAQFVPTLMQPSSHLGAARTCALGEKQESGRAV
jgi:hypothetical protein